MRQTEIRAVFEIILYFALVACITFLIIHFVGQRTVVNGVSMQPTLSDGDNLIVDKLSYRFHDPDRFDIIVFPQEDGRYFIKRIIGLPGESVRIDEDGFIYINGENLQESYGKEVMRDWQKTGYSLEQMNILCWVITGTTAWTAVWRKWDRLWEKGS